MRVLRKPPGAFDVRLTEAGSTTSGNVIFVVLKHYIAF